MANADTKVALVTGGARRIGAHLCRSLHEAGYDIALHYRSSTAEADALAALVALDQGPSFRLSRLGRMDAVRSLVASVPVPLAPPLWSHALAVAADTVSRVPVYRMAWSPSEPPWDRLAEALAKG